MSELITDPYFNGLLAGFVVMVIVAIIKKYWKFFNSSTELKRVAVVVLAISSAVLAEIQLSGTISLEAIAKCVATAIIGSFGLYETVGKATKSLLNKPL